MKIAEAYRVGGTCVIRGCVPKKLMVYASRFADAFEDAEGYGWSVPEPSFDWRRLVAAKDAEIARLSGIYVANLEKAGVEILQGHVKVVDPHAVELDGRRITAERILVATGGEPVMPGKLPGVEHAISSNEIFDLTEFPRRLMVVGGGYIGVEFRLGLHHGSWSKVTLVNRANGILRAFDIDMRTGVQEALTKAGIDFKLERMLETIEKRADGLAVTLNDGETIMADQVLLAMGRRPSTEGLGLAEVGVDLGPHGEVCVDPLSQSSVPSIYAVGDVTDRVALTPVAIREGQAFADTIYGGTEVAIGSRDDPHRRLHHSGGGNRRPDRGAGEDDAIPASTSTPPVSSRCWRRCRGVTSTWSSRCSSTATPTKCLACTCWAIMPANWRSCSASASRRVRPRPTSIALARCIRPLPKSW